MSNEYVNPNINGMGHLDLSKTHKCKKCSKAIKNRLVHIKEKAPSLCYKCYKAAQGVKNGKV